MVVDALLRRVLPVLLAPSVGCSLLVDTDVGGSMGPEVTAPPFCQTSFGPVGDPSSFVVGSILPTEGSFGALGLSIQNAIELAVTDINEVGLGSGRRIGVVACDSSGMLDQGLEAARYLVEARGVPAIIGPAFSGIFIEATTQVTVPAGVMTISPSATSPLIGDLDDNGLAWRTAASDEFQGVAISDLVRARGLARVIALGKGDAYGRGLLGKVNENIGVELGEAGYWSAEYDDPGTVMNPDYATPIIEALNRIPAPGAVLLLGTNEVSEMMRLFEAEFERTNTATSARPRYILADGGKSTDTLDVVDQAPNLMARIEGTEADHRAEPLFRAWSLRYQQRFGQAPGIYNTNSYDATFLLAYAAMTVGGGIEPTGRQLADAMARVSDLGAQVINAGPADLGRGRQLLTAGSNINYNGVSGPLNFDLSRGEAPANVSLWRVSRGTNQQLRFDPTPAGSYVVGAGGRGEWTFPN